MDFYTVCVSVVLILLRMIPFLFKEATDLVRLRLQVTTHFRGPRLHSQLNVQRLWNALQLCPPTASPVVATLPAQLPKCFPARIGGGATHAPAALLGVSLGTRRARDLFHPLLSRARASLRFALPSPGAGDAVLLCIPSPCSPAGSDDTSRQGQRTVSCRRSGATREACPRPRPACRCAPTGCSVAPCVRPLPSLRREREGALRSPRLARSRDPAGFAAHTTRKAPRGPLAHAYT